MLAFIAGLALALVPCVLVTGLLWVTARTQAARARRAAQQIELTDAVHRELGPIVAPTVRQPLLGPPQVIIPVPLRRADVVGRVVTVINDALVSMDKPMARARIVLTAQEKPRAA